MTAFEAERAGVYITGRVEVKAGSIRLAELSLLPRRHEITSSTLRAIRLSELFEEVCAAFMLRGFGVCS